jgi:hypothetical protein
MANMMLDITYWMILIGLVVWLAMSLIEYQVRAWRRGRHINELVRRCQKDDKRRGKLRVMQKRGEQ